MRRRLISWSAAGAVVLLAAALACFGVADSDVFWHLEHGARMLSERSLVDVDDWSHTAAGQRSTYYSWLAEIMGSVLYEAGGFALLIAAKAVLVAGVASLLALSLRQRGVRGLSAASWMLLALVLMRYRFYLRPELFSLFLIPLTDLLCLRWLKSGNRRVACCLPVVALIWANLHPHVLIGLGIMGAHSLSGLVTWPLKRPEPGSRSLSLLLLTGVAFLASLVNPYGWRIYTPLLRLWDESAIGQIPTREWLPPDWEGFSFFYVTLALASLLLICAWRRLTWGDRILFLASAGLALMSLRNVALFGLMGVPVVAAAAESVRPVVSAWAAKQLPGLTRLAGSLACGLMFAGLWIFVATTLFSPHASVIHLDESRHYRPGFGLAHDSAPVAALEFVEAEQLPGPLWNSWALGGYVIQRSWPRLKVSQDGRQFLFEDHLAAQLERGIAPLLGELGIRLALVRHEDVAADHALRARGDYALVFFDDVASVWVRRDVLASEGKALTPLTLLRPAGGGVGHVGENELDEAVRLAERAVELSPESGRGWMIRGLLARRQGKPEEAHSHFERALACDERQATHWANLALLPLEAGRYSEAASLLEEAVALEPGASGALYNLALARLGEGRDGAARRLLKRCIEASEGDSTMQARAGQLLSQI